MHATLRPSGEILTPITSRVTMGEFGVGSRGAVGGTISTAAPYYEMYDVLDENITFVEAREALFAARLPGRIHAMTDVTNGGGANSSGALVLTCMFSDI